MSPPSRIDVLNGNNNKNKKKKKKKKQRQQSYHVYDEEAPIYDVRQNSFSSSGTDNTTPSGNNPYDISYPSPDIFFPGEMKFQTAKTHLINAGIGWNPLEKKNILPPLSQLL